MGTCTPYGYFCLNCTKNSIKNEMIAIEATHIHASVIFPESIAKYIAVGTVCVTPG